MFEISGKRDFTWLPWVKQLTDCQQRRVQVSLKHISTLVAPCCGFCCGEYQPGEMFGNQSQFKQQKFQQFEVRKTGYGQTWNTELKTACCADPACTLHFARSLADTL